MKFESLAPIIAAAFLCTPALCATNSECPTDYSQLTTWPATFTPEQVRKRQELLRSIIDPSQGRARFTAGCATVFLGLAPENLTRILELHDWCVLITHQIKAQTNFNLAEKEALKCLAPDQTICLNFSLNESGQVAERTGEKYHIPKESPSRTALRRLLAELVSRAAPFSNPPNRLPINGGVIFEFYLSQDQHLNLTIVPTVENNTMFPVRGTATNTP